MYTLKQVIEEYYQEILNQPCKVTEKQYQFQQKNFINVLRIFRIDPDWLKVHGVYSIPDDQKDFIMSVLERRKENWLNQVRERDLIFHNKEDLKNWIDHFLEIIRAASSNDQDFIAKKDLWFERCSLDTIFDLFEVYNQACFSTMCIDNVVIGYRYSCIPDDLLMVFFKYISDELSSIEERYRLLHWHLNDVASKENEEWIFNSNTESCISYRTRLTRIRSFLEHEPEYKDICEKIRTAVQNGGVMHTLILEELDKKKRELMQSVEQQLFGNIVPCPQKPKDIRLSTERLFQLAINQYKETRK